ncbi:MAG: serine/threonine-protein kinase [Polyangiales bacterium]
MIRLPTAAVSALRNRLAERGARPSISLPHAVSGDELLDRAIAEQYGPLCDAMYVMMAADGEISGAERDVMRGALRELDDRIRSRHVEALVAASADALEREGKEARYKALSEALVEDRPRAEAAVLLAAAVAYADGEIASSEDEVIGDLMTALAIDAPRMRELIGSLERIDTVLERDAKADAADVVVHAALRLRTPEDFERLAAKTDRPDVTIALRLYAAFVRALDDLLDKSVDPRSVPTASVAALRNLADGLQDGRSPRLDELREALRDVASALERVDRANALRKVFDDGGESPPLSALDIAVSHLSLLAGKSLDRLSVAYPKKRVEIDLRDPLEAIVLDRPGARDAMAPAIDAALGPAKHTIPSAILATIQQVLSRLATLPKESASTAMRMVEKKPLPDWMPKSRTLGGWYIVEPLSDGGGGSVFVVVRADERHEQTPEKFALKVPHYDAVAARTVSESEYLSVFKREAGALLAIPEHPNIAGFVTFDARARPKPLLVMELVEGVDCGDLIKRRELDTKRAVDILDGVLAGLAAMHEAGVGHLDVKPSNVVLRKGNEPVLVDFGLAGRQIRVGCATPMYASPEVWGNADDDASAFTADIYSFGYVAYEVLAGKLLFEAQHVLALLAEHIEHDGDPAPVKAWMDDPELAPIGGFLYKCLRKNAKDRPSLTKLRAELAELRPVIEALSWPLAGSE